MSLDDDVLGDAETRARIARARASDATLPALARLTTRDFAALLDARRATPDAPWLIYHGDDGLRRAYTYADLLSRVAARVRSLLRLGVGRGDRVATLFHNDPEGPLTCFAAWRLGACVVPVNMGEDAERIAFVLEHSEAKAVLYLPEHAGHAERLRARLPGIAVWAATDALGEAPRAGDLLSDVAAPEAEDEALIVYTSGTTGAPKGVVLTQQNLLADADCIARWHGIDAGSRLQCVLPIHHVNGLVVTLVTPLSVGASTVLLRRFQTGSFWRRIAEEGVHVVSVVPTLLAFLLEEEAGTAGLDLSGFRHLICGAGPLTVDLARRFEERFGVRIVHGYGLSETTCYSCFLPLDLAAAEHAHFMRDFGFPSIGVPVDANEMAIHDAEGNALPAGRRGEIVLRGVNVMKGYYRRPEANAETFRHGWFRSGDEGFFERDAKGRPFFFITGRIKELIIRGGVNLSPFEIDEVLNGIPGVKRGLAVGFENDWYGEEVGAYVQLEPGVPADAEGILAACRAKLPFSKAPKVVVFGDEIPVTSTGKYQRGRLRPHFVAHKGAQFREPKPDRQARGRG
ncbi:MAG TPA: class I adenylate-forming enzyme family protein [Myxococcota bacterium]|jgi:long-chain acyl-CoA synthetase|nr:class I adenylate-forming enzyme family protein [Myxococcota bacterium]